MPADPNDPLGLRRPLADYDDDEPCFVAGMVVPAGFLKHAPRGPIEFTPPPTLDDRDRWNEEAAFEAEIEADRKWEDDLADAHWAEEQEQ